MMAGLPLDANIPQMTIMANGMPFIGMSGFGASAPASDLFKHFGITAEAVAEAAKKRI